MKSGAKKHSDFVAKVRAEKGLPPLQRDNATPLRETLHWVWDAFTSLSRSRLVNEAGPQPITIGDMAAYFAFAEPPTEMDKLDFLFFIEELDIVYCREMHRRIEEERKKAEREAQKNRRRPSRHR